MEKSIKLRMTRMPNYIIFEPGKIYSEEKLPSMPIEELSRQEAEQYAEEMKQAFIAHWESKQKTFSDQESKQTIAK